MSRIHLCKSFYNLFNKSFFRESIVRTEAQFVRAVKALEGDPEKTGKNIISVN